MSDIKKWDDVNGVNDFPGRLTAFLESATDAYASLQLRRTDDTLYERFESYASLQRQGKEPDVDHYEVVYPYTFSPPSQMQAFFGLSPVSLASILPYFARFCLCCNAFQVVEQTLNTKGVQQLPSHTISAVLVFRVDLTSLNISYGT